MSSVEEFIIENSTAFSCVIDFETRRVEWLNRGTSKMFPGTEKGDYCYRAFFGYEAPCAACPLGEVKSSRASASLPVRFDSLRRWFKIHYQYAVMDGRECCVCIGTDVTGLKSSLQIAQEMLDSFHTLAYIVDRKTHDIRFMNRTLRNMLPETGDGAKCHEVLWDSDCPCHDCPLSDLGTARSHEAEIYNGKLGRLLHVGAMLLKTPGEEDLAIFTGYDITHRIEYERKLKTLAYRDRQLDIGNRAAFHRDMDGMAETGQSCQVGLVSLGNFNNINMLFGRERGDRILKAFAESFLAIVPGEKVYRVGGCKFALIAATYEAGCAMLDAVWNRVYRRLSSGEKNFHFPVDAVFVGFPDFAASPEALLINAEYRLKNSRDGKQGKRLLFGEEDRKMMERRSLLTSVIRQALENGAFQVFYQPIYTVSDDDYAKAEALLRLHDRRLGWIAPDEFIPIAEEQGLIHELGLYVLKRVCAKLAGWRDKGFRPLAVHINVSTVQFSGDGFFNRFMGIVDRYGIDPSQIVIEVTESIMIQSFEYMMSVMNRFIDRGVRFSLDDFGTGYSSLNYVAALPISSIKLDKSFTDSMQESDVHALLVKNVANIARGLRYELIAEGVETAAQMNALRQLGFAAMQGYYFSRPLPENDLDDFLLREKCLRNQGNASVSG
ncbi:bifunctional diguanylate cyclase/phosphodiesterase [Oxalobacter paraformigenes]|uniref:Uncharacterized protein n=1 Tax=Oxalobacter paraformigenes TaxID=556268 RepID=C3X305_9BURK|nr:bifunctional diguanylate cyclase/phosphodiesterase [Oxalobacter paraformigenes]EEO27591.2 hypothetical protein OFAG_00744 [Oxalobacter paraformigenes]